MLHNRFELRFLVLAGSLVFGTGRVAAQEAEGDAVASPSASAAAADEAQAPIADSPSSEESVAAEAPASSPPPVAPASTESSSGDPATGGKPDLIADGGRVSVRDGDFSIKPPVGWEVFNKLENLTLLMQVPRQPGMKYQRTIQVASFSEPRFIDDVTAKEYEEVITNKFSAISSAIEDYRIRNHVAVDLADGRQGLLFYAEFKLESVSMMQAHILVSSASRHYLMTFTDIAEHFESDASSEFLTQAWDAMISVELSAPTPKRFESFAKIGVTAVVVALLGFGVVAFRSWRSSRKYQSYASEREGDAVSLDPQTLATAEPVSNIRSIASFRNKAEATKDAAPLDDDDNVSMTKDDIAV